MEERTYVIEIGDVPAARANQYASELKEDLLDATGGKIKVEHSKADQGTQDFGATLVLLLGTPALIVVAKGVRDWLARRPDASVTIKSKDGEIIASNLKSKDAAALADKWLSEQ